MQNLPRKPNRRRYPPGVVVLWLSGLALSVGNLFVGPAVLKWLLIGVDFALNLGAVAWACKPDPPAAAGVVPYTREELAQQPVPPDGRWGRLGVIASIGGLVVAVVFGVLALVLH